MPREKIGREELYGHTTEKQQKAIKTLHSAPEIEYSLKKKKRCQGFENKKYFACAPQAILYSTYLPST